MDHVDFNRHASSSRAGRLARIAFCSVAILAAAAVAPRAAEITYENGEVNVIAIEGRITADDPEQFARIVPDPQKKTAVLLASPGGNVMAALALGEMIHQNGYTTLVPDNQVCASACGLIWLGGATRMVSETAKIGFHAAFVGTGAAKSESGVGNAMIGAYLTRIGLSYKAVEFLTSAPPGDMEWLHPDQARAIGIEFVTVPAEPSSEAWSSPPRTGRSLARDRADVPAPAPAPPTAEERARNAILFWYQLWANAGTDIGALVQHYGATIQYYGGTTAKAKVLLEKQKFAVRWPIRSFTVHPDSWNVTCASTCSVKGIVDWNVSSPERGERSIGSANFAYEIPVNGPLVILSENGSLITAHKEPLATANAAAEAPPAALNAAYGDGRQARIQYEQWVDSLSDLAFKAGALFWAANRSSKPPPSCTAAATSDSWLMGCQAARARLTPVDIRRKTEKDFWFGWNSL